MKRAISLASSSALLFLAHCAGSKLPELVKPDTGLEQNTGQSTCQVAKDPLNPLIVEWPGISKTELDTTSQQGLVVVSYAGCVLKVLSNCHAQGSYELKKSVPNLDSFDIEDENELFARLPLGVASLKGELSQGKRIRLEYVSVGQRVAVKPPVTLMGACDGATHYVRTVTVGAYLLETEARGKVQAGAELANTAVGGKKVEGEGHRRSAGDLAKCKSGTGTAEDCGALLQLGLAPLFASGGSATSAGFGEGLGAVTVVPTVGEFQGLGSGGLADADPAILEELQRAKRVDKDASEGASSKAAAWARLVAVQGKNPYRALAEERRARWQAVADAEVRRQAEIQRVLEQYRKDQEKLQRLVSLDDDVVSPAQKQAYKRELAQVYAPWKSVIEQSLRQADASARLTADLDAVAFRAGERWWQKTSLPARMNWVTARIYCSSLGLAGGGWRLPTKEELDELFLNHRNLLMGSADFLVGYWSSTPVSGHANRAMSVGATTGAFAGFDGMAGGGSDVNAELAVRCVR